MNPYTNINNTKNNKSLIKEDGFAKRRNQSVAEINTHKNGDVDSNSMYIDENREDKSDEVKTPTLDGHTK